MKYREPLGNPRVGVLTIALRLPGCDSLKNKRSILRRLFSELQTGTNLSVAEIGDHDVPTAAVMGIVTINARWPKVESVLKWATQRCRNHFDIDVVDEQVERLI